MHFLANLLSGLRSKLELETENGVGDFIEFGLEISDSLPHESGHPRYISGFIESQSPRQNLGFGFYIALLFTKPKSSPGFLMHVSTEAGHHYAHA